MTPLTKAREFWVSPDRETKTPVLYEDSKGMEEIVDCFCACEEPLDDDAIHVIEKSAYDKAVEALKLVAKETTLQEIGHQTMTTQSYHLVPTVMANLAIETLKELGEATNG